MIESFIVYDTHPLDALIPRVRRWCGSHGPPLAVFGRRQLEWKMRRWRSWFPQPILARLLVDAAPNITADTVLRFIASVWWVVDQKKRAAW